MMMLLLMLTMTTTRMKRWKAGDYVELTWWPVWWNRNLVCTSTFFQSSSAVRQRHKFVLSDSLTCRKPAMKQTSWSTTTTTVVVVELHSLMRPVALVMTTTTTKMMTNLGAGSLSSEILSRSGCLIAYGRAWISLVSEKNNLIQIIIRFKFSENAILSAASA